MMSIIEESWGSRSLLTLPWKGNLTHSTTIGLLVTIHFVFKVSFNFYDKDLICRWDVFWFKNYTFILLYSSSKIWVFTSVYVFLTRVFEQLFWRWSLIYDIHLGSRVPSKTHDLGKTCSPNNAYGVKNKVRTKMETKLISSSAMDSFLEVITFLHYFDGILPI